jgi:1-acyl-sn-glycerol-3-phosphate acyltransferase
LFWSRRSFLKRPGTIVVEALAPIPPGLERRQFLRELHARIETATARLVAEASADDEFAA